MIVLCRASLIIFASSSAENVTASLEGHLIDLAIGLYDVDVDSSGVLEDRDALGTLVPTHDGATVCKNLDERGRGGRGHREPLVIGEFLASLFVNVPT